MRYKSHVLILIFPLSSTGFNVHYFIDFDKNMRNYYIQKTILREASFIQVIGVKLK